MVWLHDVPHRPESRHNASSVVERWGVAPEQMVDFLALWGDSSDIIPGVPQSQWGRHNGAGTMGP